MVQVESDVVVDDVHVPLPVHHVFLMTESDDCIEGAGCF